MNRDLPIWCANFLRRTAWTRTWSARATAGNLKRSWRRESSTSSFRITTCRRSRGCRRWRWRKRPAQMCRLSWCPARLARRRQLKACARERPIICSNNSRNACRPPSAAPCRRPWNTPGCARPNWSWSAAKIFPHSHGKLAGHPLPRQPRGKTALYQSIH